MLVPSHHRRLFCLVALLHLLSAWTVARASTKITVPLVPIHDTASFSFPAPRTPSQSQTTDHPIQFVLPPTFTGNPADCLNGGPTCRLVATNITATYDPISISIQNTGPAPAVMSYNALVLYGFGPGYTPDDSQTLQYLSLQAPGSSFAPPQYACASTCSTTLSAVRTQNYNPSAYGLLGNYIYEVRFSAGLGGLATGSFSIGLTITGTVTFLVPDGPPVVQMVDPAFGLLDGTQITANHDRLATGGRLVKGVTADGTSRLVLRIAASYAGEQFLVTLPGDGSFFALDTPLSPSQSGTITVATSSPPYFAYIFFQAPADFAIPSGPDLSTQATRQLSGTVQSLTTKLSATISIKVMRPPVVLVHGLWSDSDTWNSFTPLINSPVLQISRFDYSQTNGSSFSTNAGLLSAFLQKFINTVADINEVAEGKVDIVAHSMGGNVTRSVTDRPPRTFGEGMVHKLITLGTPHLGSPVARELNKAVNACLAFRLTEAGKPVYDGAIADLSGDGNGSGLSKALQSQLSLSTAYLAGVVASSQIHDFFSGLHELSGVDCAPYPYPPLATSFSKENYPALMGGQGHDGIVPLQSAWNNNSGDVWGDGETTGARHSEAVLAFGVTGPNLLDGDSKLAIKTVELLNTPISDPVFK